MDWHTLLCCKHCVAKQAQLPWFPVCSPDVFCLCRPPVSWESWGWGWKSIFTGCKPDIFACNLSQISCHKEAGPWWTLKLLRFRNISAHCSCIKRTGRQNIHSLNTLLETPCLYWVVLAATRCWKCSSEILLCVDMWTSNHVYRLVSSTFKLPSSSTATLLRHSPGFRSGNWRGHWSDYRVHGASLRCLLFWEDDKNVRIKRGMSSTTMTDYYHGAHFIITPLVTQQQSGFIRPGSTCPVSVSLRPLLPQINILGWQEGI